MNRRPDGQEEVTVEDLKEERNDDILQHYEHLANYAEQSETGKGTSSSGKVEKVWWHQPAMFCLITSSKLSSQ